MKRIALVVAVLLAACGTEKAPQSADGDGAGDGGGSVPVASVQADTTTLKVVLKTAKAVYTGITRYDGNFDDFFPISCTPATVAVDCAGYENVSCQNNQCAIVSYVPTIFYVRNSAVAGTTIPVPCDDRVYTAEVYGAKAGAAPGTFEITEVHSSAPFTMPVGCAQPTLTWTAALPGTVSPLLPSYTFSPIYVGFGPPFDRFNATVGGLRYPWSGLNWSLTYAGQPVASPTVYVGGIATFAAPATTAPITFTGVFRLDGSLLLTGEAANS